jgi:hypothetical protein
MQNLEIQWQSRSAIFNEWIVIQSSETEKMDFFEILPLVRESRDKNYGLQFDSIWIRFTQSQSNQIFKLKKSTLSLKELKLD